MQNETVAAECSMPLRLYQGSPVFCESNPWAHVLSQITSLITSLALTLITWEHLP